MLIARLETFLKMLGSSKIDVDQLNRCVRHYEFLSPRLKTTCFSTYQQRTECNFPSQSQAPDKLDNAFVPSTRVPSSFWRLFSSRKAACEGPSATDKMERAEESLKQKGSTAASIVSEMEIQNYLAKETGKDRLIKMFSRNHKGEASSEFTFLSQVTIQAAGATFLVMTVLAGRQAKEEFIAKNRATVFKTRFQAFRRMQDKIFLFSLKEGMKWAVRVSVFSLSFMLISQSIAVYRNKSSPWEYAIASAATIGALKANMGLRGFVVATGFGGILGVTMGFIVLAAMKATNETQEQRHYWQIHKELEREKYYESKGKVQLSEAAAF